MDFLLAVQVHGYVYTARSRGWWLSKDSCPPHSKSGSSLRSFSVMGCTITQQDDFSIVFSHAKALSELNPQLLICAAGTTGEDAATITQANVYRHVIAKMLHIGRMSAPVIPLQVSMAASKLADLRCHHLRPLT